VAAAVSAGFIVFLLTSSDLSVLLVLLPPTAHAGPSFPTDELAKWGIPRDRFQVLDSLVGPGARAPKGGSGNQVLRCCFLYPAFVTQT
jgi:hypothetical protein